MVQLMLALWLFKLTYTQVISIGSVWCEQIYHQLFCVIPSSPWTSEPRTGYVTPWPAAPFEQL